MALGAVDKLPGTNVSPALGNLVQMTRESLLQGLGGAPQDTIDPNASGKAINAALKRADMNIDFLYDNIDKFLKRVGIVYQSMAREVYSATPNRKMRIINEQGAPEMVALNSDAGFNGQFVRMNDLAKGSFEVSVGTSPDYATAQEETFEALKDIVGLMAPDDPYRSIAVRLLILQKDGIPEDAKAALRRELLAQGVVKPENEEEQQFLQGMAQAQQNQGVDANTLLLQSMAKEQETKAQMNEASTADKIASAAKKAAEAEEIKIDSYIKAEEAKRVVSG